MSVPFTPWSVDSVAEQFIAWRFNRGKREDYVPRHSFKEAMADCDDLNRIARASPEWIAWRKERDGK